MPFERDNAPDLTHVPSSEELARRARKECKFRRLTYECCQLTAAINARICLGGSDVTDEEFERLVDLVGCRCGSAISIEKAYPPLGVEGEIGPCEEEWVRKHLPCQLMIWSLPYGFHEVLAYQWDGECFHVLGAEAIQEDGRFTWSHLKALVDANCMSKREPPCRTFRLKEDVTW